MFLDLYIYIYQLIVFVTAKITCRPSQQLAEGQVKVTSTESASPGGIQVNLVNDLHDYRQTELDIKK